MQSVISGRPLDVVVVSPPPPPAWSEPTTGNDLGTSPLSCSYHRADSTERNLIWLIRYFASSLRYAHRKTITWPSSTVNTERMEAARYIREILLQPVADLFYQLYSKKSKIFSRLSQLDLLLVLFLPLATFLAMMDDRHQK
ncbi:hypothetical protein FRC16_008326 [Serendipita sp. 398]|nr:hypothetical protein FRC16_008326 [Serendipita sp. 398]